MKFDIKSISRDSKKEEFVYHKEDEKLRIIQALKDTTGLKPGEIVANFEEDWPMQTTFYTYRKA